MTQSYRQYIPISFTLIVYLAWFGMQGPNSAVQNFIAQVSIAVTMIFGSFVAGGTALGGGAVAFPVMTKILAIEPTTAKVFSLAIQSFGMTAASLAIIFGGIRYYKPIVKLALLGALPGVLISLTMIAEHIPRLATKSLFSIFLIVFVVTLLHAQWQGKKQLSMSKMSNKSRYFVLGTAFIGGLVSGLIGSGSDIAIFALLMLYFRADLKIATATSVIVMAVTSAFATCINYFYLQTITVEISNYVLAAIPVVIIGAPLGAYFCARVPKQFLMWFLISLISLEVGFTCFELLNR